MNEKLQRLYEWDQLFIRFALDVANMSRAVRLKVGAVLVNDRRVVGIGFNGTPAGTDNCCEHEVDGQLVTNDNVIHAEDNLLRFATEQRIHTSGSIMYVTHSPCPACCKKIVGYDVSEVVYLKKFRDTSGLQYLVDNGVKVREHNG